MQTIARLERAAVSLGGNSVLREVDLIVGRDQVVGVSGPNGSGKTTLLRAIATLIAPSSGSVEVLGANAGSPDIRRVRRSIGLIGHEPGLIPELTLEENLAHVARVGSIDDGRVARALEVVGLSGVGDRRTTDCSFGMKRRAEIAHWLLTRPLLLLLDEAGSGLDDSARELIGALIRSVRGRDGAAVIVSHDMAYLEANCSVIMTLTEGRLEASS